MKKIVIRCLTVPSKGYGNFNRCLNLAEYLRKKNCNIFFVVDSNKIVSNELKQRKFDYLSIPVTKTYFEKTSIFTNFLKNNFFDLCLIDMREYGENLSKKLFYQNFKHILFDDAWCKKVYANAIFNGTNVSDYHNYEIINNDSDLFLGTKYWILDKNFRIFRKKHSSIKNKKNFSIVISMGGSDPFDLTTTIVNSLLHIENLRLSVILGPFFQNTKKLKKMIRSSQNISFHESPSKMWKLFSNADIAISNGGNTLFELACIGIPTICIPTVKHEIKYTEKFNSQNFSLNLKLREKNSHLITSSVLNLINNTKLLKTMSYNGQKMVDGKGLFRVTKKILEQLQ